MQVLQAVVLLVVAARVAPSDFALLGIAAVLFNAQFLVGSLGLGQALIYREVGDRFDDAVDSAAMITIVLGSVVGTAAFLSAPLLAKPFDKGFETHDVVNVVRIMSVVFVLATTADVAQALVEKALAFKGRAIVEVCAVLAYAGIALGLLAGGYGVWGALIGRPAQFLVLGLGYWTVSPTRPRFPPRPDWATAWSLFRFGRWLGGSALIGFAVFNLDNIAVGSLVGAAALGAYALAYAVTNIVPTFLTQTVGKVSYPTFARIRNDLPALSQAYANSVHLIVLIIVPITAALLTVVPPALVDLFGHEWDDAVVLIAILAFYGVGRVIGLITGVLLTALGRPSVAFHGSLIALVVPLVAGVALISYDAKGIALAFTLGQLSAAAYGLVRTRSFITAALMRRLVPTFVATLAATLAATVLGQVADGPGSAALAAAGLGIIYVGAVVCLDRDVRLRLASITQGLRPLSRSSL